MRDSVILIVCVRAQGPLADCKIDWAHKTHRCRSRLPYTGEETAIAAARTIVHGAPRVRIVGQGVGGRLRQDQRHHHCNQTFPRHDYRKLVKSGHTWLPKPKVTTVNQITITVIGIAAVRISYHIG